MRRPIWLLGRVIKPNRDSEELDHFHWTPKADTSQTPSSSGISISADVLEQNQEVVSPESRQTGSTEALGQAWALVIKVITLISVLLQTHMVRMATSKYLGYTSRKLRPRNVDDIIQDHLTGQFQLPTISQK